MKIFVVCLLVFCEVKAISVVELFGLTPRLKDIVKLSTSVNNSGPATSAYLLDPSIHTFLKQYKSRTQFCEYKCLNFFDLPCFLLFGCNIHIRDFTLIFVFPLFALLLTGLCCGKGIWTFSCWLHYLATFSGIRFVVYALKLCAGENKKPSSNKQIQIDNEKMPQSDDRLSKHKQRQISEQSSEE